MDISMFDLSNNGDMTNYKGAWIYPISDGYEANLKGFHYQADTVDELISKIDTAINEYDIDKTVDMYSAQKDRATRIQMFEDAEDELGPEWAIVFHLNAGETDDSFENEDTKEIILNAPDLETAVKYAQQYARKMQLNSETKELWTDAEIISVEQR